MFGYSAYVEKKKKTAKKMFSDLIEFSVDQENR